MNMKFYSVRRSILKITWSQSRVILTKSITGLLGLILGLFYARLLGPTNKAALSCIFLTNFLLSSIYLNSHNINFKVSSKSLQSSEKIGHIKLSGFKIVFYSILQTVIVTVYLQLNFKYYPSLLVISFLYSIVAGLNYQISIILLKESRYQYYAFRELALSLIQPIVLTILLYSINSSNIISILACLTISNLIMVLHFYTRNGRNKQYLALNFGVCVNIGRVVETLRNTIEIRSDVLINIATIHLFKLLIMFSFTPDTFARFVLIYSFLSIPLNLAEGIIQLSLAKPHISKKLLTISTSLVVSAELVLGMFLLALPGLPGKLIGDDWNFDFNLILAAILLVISRTIYEIIFNGISGSITSRIRGTHLVLVFFLPLFSVVALISLNKNTIVNYSVVFFVSYLSFAIFAVSTKSKLQSYRSLK
jgi:hypothetical protein